MDLTDTGTTVTVIAGIAIALGVAGHLTTKRPAMVTRARPA